ALIVVGGAGYLGAVSGKPKATTPEPAPSAETTAAKVDPPPAPLPTASAHQDPAPPPAPAPVETTPPARTHEVPAEPAPTAREPVREPRRTTTDEEQPVKPRTKKKPTTDEESGGGPPETRLPEPAEAKPTIDQGALRAAFAEGEAKAKSCLGATSPSGTARISVTFVPSGEVAGAIVSGSPFANTIEGACMATKFKTLHLPPFSGPEVIVRKSISFL
ncbi:MAG: hypothetical protein ABW133_24060, partial [Polyangiaceae bacterium]